VTEGAEVNCIVGRALKFKAENRSFHQKIC